MAKTRKIVKSNLFEFHKGSDPMASLGLGVYEKIKKKLDEIYHREGRPINILEYKIIGLDKIEIFFSDEYKKRRMKEDDPDRFIKWIIKYIELPRFVMNEKRSKDTFYGQDFHSDELILYEAHIYDMDFPRNDNIEYKYVMKIGNNQPEEVGEETKKRGEIILKAMNKNYEPVWGFELVDTIKEPNTQE